MKCYFIKDRHSIFQFVSLKGATSTLNDKISFVSLAVKAAAHL